MSRAWDDAVSRTDRSSTSRTATDMFLVVRASPTSMQHKAFAFDWNAFQRQLHPILHQALCSGSVAELAAFIEHHRHSLTDPYEGQPLPDDWSSLMESRDVHDHGDFALTLYYSPTADNGIGDSWLELSDDSSVANALLGAPFGPTDKLFDPGRMGSYFQTPDAVSSSLRVLFGDDRPELSDFVDLLEFCEAEGLGIFVTF